MSVCFESQATLSLQSGESQRAGFGGGPVQPGFTFVPARCAHRNPQEPSVKRIVVVSFLATAALPSSAHAQTYVDNDRVVSGDPHTTGCACCGALTGNGYANRHGLQPTPAAREATICRDVGNVQT